MRSNYSINEHPDQTTLEGKKFNAISRFVDESPNSVQFLPNFSVVVYTEFETIRRNYLSRVTFAFSFPPAKVSDWQGRLFHRGRRSIVVGTRWRRRARWDSASIENPNDFDDVTSARRRKEKRKRKMKRIDGKRPLHRVGGKRGDRQEEGGISFVIVTGNDASRRCAG